MDLFADGANVASCSPGVLQQGQRTLRGFRGAIPVLDAVPATASSHMLSKELSRPGIQDPYLQLVPLHLYPPTNPARRRAVVGRVHFDAAVEMYGALAV